MQKTKAEVGSVKTEVGHLKAESAKTANWRETFSEKLDTLWSYECNF